LLALNSRSPAMPIRTRSLFVALGVGVGLPVARGSMSFRPVASGLRIAGDVVFAAEEVSGKENSRTDSQDDEAPECRADRHSQA
jgi:hypothetical protein